MEIVLSVLRGEDLNLASREICITVATVSAWQDQFVANGQPWLKSRAADGCDDELARLKALVGDLTMSHTTSPSRQRPYGVARVC